MNDQLVLQQTVRLLGGGQRAGSLFGDSGLTYAEDDAGAAGLDPTGKLEEVLAAQKLTLKNVEEGMATVAGAEQGLDAIRRDIESLEALAHRAADPALAAPTRAKAVGKAALLVKDVDAVARGTRHLGLSLLDGNLAPGGKARVVNDSELWLASGEVGLDVIPELGARALGLASVDLASPEGARAALETLAAAKARLAQVGSSLEAVGARLEKSAARLEKAIGRQAAAAMKAAERQKDATEKRMPDLRLGGAIGLQGQGQRLSSGRVFSVLG